MQKNLIISLVIGQLVALLPIWDWGDTATPFDLLLELR